MKSMRLCWLPLLAGLMGAAHALGQPVTLRVSAQQGTEPKFITDGRGGVVGLCVDLFRSIENIDPGLRFIGDQDWLPPPRANSNLASHQHDALCAVQRTPERERQYVFLDVPLFTLQYMLLVRAEDPVVVNGWDDVRKLGGQGVVLVNRGYTTAETMEQLGGLRINASAASPAMNLQMLIAGRARFFLHRDPGLKKFLQLAGAADKVKILPSVMYTRKVYMALGTHLDAAVIARVQRALELIEKSGELARLLEKWG